MRLNPECLRDILVVVEDKPTNIEYTIDHLIDKLPQYDEETINYHCVQMLDAELLVGYEPIIIGTNPFPQISRILDLTFYGHSFLADIRSDNVWNKVKDVAKQTGTYSIHALSTIATNVVSTIIQNTLT